MGDGTDNRTGVAGPWATYYVEDTEFARHQGRDTRRREVHRNAARTMGLFSKKVTPFTNYPITE